MRVSKITKKLFKQLVIKPGDIVHLCYTNLQDGNVSVIEKLSLEEV